MAVSESSFSLPPTSDAPAVARAIVRDCCAQATSPEVLEDITLCVSELVTNALDHAAPPIELRVALDRDRLRVEVQDNSRASPVRKDPLPTDFRGRGLVFVACIAARWGFHPSAAGKTVWAEFVTV
jgi:anti-sigma regulatory factor (Ser/Thr protein kinase)